MLAQWLTNISLSLALAASSPLVNPSSDPDVQPHIQRGYFMMDQQAKPASAMTLELSQKISQEFLKQFESRLHDKGLQFSVRVDWDINWFSAHAKFEKKSSAVVLWGGFLRAPGMNEIILATTLCHELGHLIAGPPLQTISAQDNVSTEGQSDFFAGSCLAEFAQKHPEYFKNISSEVRAYCEKDFKCSVALEGGLQIVRFMQKWGFEPYEPVALYKQAPATKTFVANVYPENQCRLDSFMTRAMCLKNSTKKCAPPACWWPQEMIYPPTH
jgi:hypothetical protein